MITADALTTSVRVLERPPVTGMIGLVAIQSSIVPPGFITLPASHLVAFWSV